MKRIALIAALVAALAVPVAAEASKPVGATAYSYTDGGGGGSQITGIYTVLVQSWECSPYRCNYYCRYAYFSNGYTEQLNCWLEMNFRGYW